MARKNTVVESINNVDETRCVDVFERPNGTFGFETYRRDPEDNRGWFPDGNYAEAVFATVDEALADATRKVAWLEDAQRTL